MYFLKRKERGFTPLRFPENVTDFFCFRDGRLDTKEYLAFTHPEEDPSMKPHVLRQVLDEKDADKDGELSFQEYIGLRGQDKDKEWLIEEKDRFDNELDKNGDNALSKEEIFAWIIPSNEDIAKDEVIFLDSYTLSSTLELPIKCSDNPDTGSLFSG